jgi:hypothetical protein
MSGSYNPQVVSHNGMWAVAAPDGTIIKDGLSNAEAWRWIDRNEYEGRWLKGDGGGAAARDDGAGALRSGSAASRSCPRRQFENGWYPMTCGTTRHRVARHFPRLLAESSRRSKPTGDENGYQRRLTRVLREIVTAPRPSYREEWREDLGGLYDAAVEFLLDQGTINPDDYPEAVDKVSTSVPLNVAEAYWAATGAYDPRDSRHPNNQPEVTLTVPKNVADVFATLKAPPTALVGEAAVAVDASDDLNNDGA